MDTKKNSLNQQNPSETKIGNEFPIVGIGASAGGLEPITKLLENLPSPNRFVFRGYPTFGHWSRKYAARNSFKINQNEGPTSHRRNEGRKRSRLRYFSRSNPDIKNGRVKLLPKSLPSKPINDFLVSLATEKKTQAIGVVLSGTSNDGTEGLKAIRAEGGITFAQDPDTAQYPDMPKNAIAAEAPDFILSPEQIAKELVRIAKSPQLIHCKTKKTEQEKVETDFKKIITMLKTSFGVDFTHYRETTVNRRITRRMVINKTENMKEYVEYLRAQPSERQALFDDMLIGVTSFFKSQTLSRL